jgi:hypothetical protein
VPFIDEEDVGLDGTTPQFTLDKYVDASSPVVVADGIEARLIEAEAAVNASDFGGATTILNDLRTLVGLDPLDTPGGEAEAVDQVFSERAFWLFATGHRLGDMRRLIRQYGQIADSVFPSGAYFKTQIPTYGPDVNFPIPVTEQNNPNLPSGAITCKDRNP